MDFKTQSKINSLSNEILDLNKKIIFREALGISDAIIDPMRERLEDLEEKLNKLNN